MEVCEDESERRQRCLQQRCESGRDVLLSPKHETVVQTEREDSGDREQDPVCACAWQLKTTHADYRNNNRAGNDEPDAGESQWRQVLETQLNEEPGRAPDSAQHQPNK